MRFEKDFIKFISDKGWEMPIEEPLARTFLISRIVCYIRFVSLSD